MGYSLGIDFWNADRGLASSKVRALTQSHDGFLWIGTDGGVMRFDGVTFTSYNTGTGHLRDNEVWALKEDQQGVLWIGTAAGLTRLYAGRSVTYTTADGLPDDWIWDLDEDRAGNLWVATARGICRINGGIFTTFTTKEGLASEATTHVASDPEGAIYAIAGRRLHRLEGGRFVALPLPAGENSGVVDLGPGADGSLWLCREDGTITQLRAGRAKTYPVEGDTGPRGGKLCEDRYGQIWYAKRNGLFHLEEGRFIRALPQATDQSLGAIISAFPDREGNLWLGTEAEGLARVRTTYISTLTAESGLADNSTRTVLEGSRGDLWIGTINGLSHWNGRAWEHHRDFEGRPLGVISALVEDGAGSLLLSANGELLRLRDGQLARETIWTDRVEVRSLHRDPQGRVWIGTNGRGLYCLEEGGLRHFDQENGLASNQVRGLLTDRHGALWVATNGGGVSRLADGKFTTYTTAQGLGSDRVTGLHEDRDGALWFLTRQGLTRLRDGRFHTFRMSDGLPADFFSGIVEDGFGKFWLSSSSGLIAVKQADFDAYVEKKSSTLTVSAFGAGDGLRSPSFGAGNQPNTARLADGRLLFCSLKGLVAVSPSAMAPSRQPPPVFIEHVLLDRQSSPVSGDLLIPPGLHSLEIRYTALNFSAPEKLHFRHRLAGHDQDWTDAGRRRFAYYASLPAGHYQFEVQAAADSGAWSEPLRFAFTVERPLVLRPWFITLCATLLAGTGLGLHFWRLQRLRGREQELQRRVTEALANVKVLGGLIPVCASCKKIRDDKGYWSQLEEYLQTHSESHVSHGICPDCMRNLYPDIAEQVLKKPDTGGT